MFHNAALHTPEALPRILSYLINEGYTVVPISQLILTGDYTIDHTGRQFPAEKAEQAERGSLTLSDASLRSQSGDSLQHIRPQAIQTKKLRSAQICAERNFF